MSFKPDQAIVPKLNVPHQLTCHAAVRMNARRYRPETVEAVLAYGREAHVRGATICAIGRKEVDRARRAGLDLRDLEGIQVVCARDGSILTVYRNRDLRGLKPRHRREYPPVDDIAGGLAGSQA